MPLGPSSHLRLARPSLDLVAAERFWVEGLGFSVLWRSDATADGGHALLVLGWADAPWHLELVDDPVTAAAHPPGEEDLLVLYADGPVDAHVDRLVQAGGRRVTARNPYWETWGVTLQDPDGYRLVLSTRGWSSS